MWLTLPSPRIQFAPTLAPVLTENKPRPWPVVVAPPPAEVKAGDPSEPVDELVMSLVISEASRRAGHDVGEEGAAALRQMIRTNEQAHAYFAAQPWKPGNRPLIPTRSISSP